MLAAQIRKPIKAAAHPPMWSFQNDWQACISYLRCPAVHHKRIRTTNLLEPSFCPPSAYRMPLTTGSLRITCPTRKHSATARGANNTNLRLRSSRMPLRASASGTISSGWRT